MNLIGYRTNIRSACQVSKGLIDQYDHLALIIVNQDNNANGDAEFRFVDKDGLRKSVIINGWILGSQAKMKYWWGQSTIELTITSPSGQTHLKQLEIKSGSQSDYWGVSTLSTVMSYFLKLVKYKSWEYLSKAEQLQAAKAKLNAVLLDAEQLRIEISSLQNELYELE